jgi:RND family efflux transporter MFP subunit
MKRRSKWLIALLVAILLAVAIGRAVVERQSRQRQAAVPPAVTAIELGPTDLVRAVPRELVRAQPVSGTLRAVDTALVKARVAGELRELAVREGDPVRAGQVLGRQDDADNAARLRQSRQQAASARAQLEIAERTLANNRALVDRGYISRNALDTSVSNAAAARANLLAAEAATEVARKAVDDAVLRAPIRGQVSQRFAQPGERLAIDARVLEIVDLSRIELEAAVPPEALAGIAVGAPASLRVDGIAEPVPARVARINPAAAAGTRAVSVYLSVEPRPALRHGLFATGEIELGRDTRLAIPVSALRNDRSRPYLLAVEADRIAAREITAGPRGRDASTGESLVAIDAGVAEGATLLAGSVGIVEEGTPVRVAGPR